MSVRVVLVDDHDIVRRGLKDLFGTTNDIEVVGEADDGERALGVVESSRPDVVLMDISMPRKGGVDATKEVIHHFPELAVVMMTSFGDQDSIARALDAGAIGYLLKHATPDDIIAAVRTASKGGAPLDPVAVRGLLRRTQLATTLARSPGQNRDGSDLSEREIQVLRAVRNGLSNKQIARELGIAERTVKAHLTKVFQRLNVSDRTQAALWAQKHLP